MTDQPLSARALEAAQAMHRATLDPTSVPPKPEDYAHLDQAAAPADDLRSRVAAVLGLMRDGAGR